MRARTIAGGLAAALLVTYIGYSAGSAAALLLTPAAEGIFIETHRYGPIQVNYDTCGGAMAGGHFHVRQIGHLNYQVTTTCRF